MSKKVKTVIYFITYENNVAEDILKRLKENYEVLELRRSEVVRELYYVSLRGKHPELSKTLIGKVNWFKIDFLEFT